MKAFENNGYEILVVGGAIRDAILNLPIKDYDLATNAKPNQIKEVVDGLKGYRYVLGPQAEKSLVNLTSLVTIPNEKEAIEITTYRRELGYAGGRTKGIFEPADTFDEDSERRDLTINAMGMTADGVVIDPQGGLEDLQNGVIRAVGDPTRRFVEDPLRMIRAIRFSVRFGIPIDQETYDSLVFNADLVTTLSGRRLRDEIGKVLVEPNGYQMLMETGILPALMPEFRGMESYHHKLDYHPEDTLYNHYIEAFKKFTTIPNRTEMGAWALLFHDIAKPQTADWNEKEGYHTFYGHDKQGGQLVLENYNNQNGPFEFSKKELQAIAWTTDNHLGRFWEMKKPMKVAAMRNNENYPLLVEVVTGDTMGIRRGGDEELQRRLKEINEITDKVNEQKAKTGNRPKDFARKVIQELNVKNQEISIALNQIEELVSTGQVSSYDEALEVLKTNRSFNIEEHIPTNMSEATTRFKVGEVYTIEAHGSKGWNTYELEVVSLTKHFVNFIYEGGQMDYDTMKIVKSGFRAKKYVSDFDNAEYAVLTFDFRRKGQENYRGRNGISPTIMSGNFDLQPQLPISED
jgi:tRNA nucleotidyltransferase/poly(A) polymerase